MPTKKIREELEQLTELLKKEKQEDLLQYKDKISNASPVARRKEGICWYPIMIDNTGFSHGERPIVKLSRSREHKYPHAFQSGKLVSFFSNGHGNEIEDSVSGVVNYVKDNQMVITLNCDDIPDWTSQGKLGVQMLFDENAYREMERALSYLKKTEEDRICELMEILTGLKEAEFDKEITPPLPQLNATQNEALNLVLNAKDLAILHGPPGTGKTTTLVEAIAETLKKEKQVLVCAPSNAAVDLLAEKLSEKGIAILRTGHPARVTDEMLQHTLDAKIANHPHYKDLKAIKKKAEEFRNLGHKYKRNFGKSEREQRKLLLSEARKLREEAEQLEFHISGNIIEKSQVILSTLVGAGSFILKGMRFSTVFIDEAAQGLEPATWIPITKAERVVFAGDHHQLPPTVKSIEAAKQGLSVTLFEKAISHNEADVMLREQYRMNKEIMGFSNLLFYNNELLANEKVASWKLWSEDMPVEFIDTAGCGFFEEVDPENRSSFNTEEADLVSRHFLQFLHQADAAGAEVTSIGVISPYRAQVAILREKLLDNNVLPEDYEQITSINTVDSFQGQERDIIYISMVRCNEKGEIGFLADTRRMNVAMTRARKKLVIIGDSATIGNNSFYAQFLDYINEIGAYRSAFEFAGF